MTVENSKPKVVFPPYCMNLLPQREKRAWSQWKVTWSLWWWCPTRTIVPMMVCEVFTEEFWSQKSSSASFLIFPLWKWNNESGDNATFSFKLSTQCHVIKRNGALLFKMMLKRSSVKWHFSAKDAFDAVGFRHLLGKYAVTFPTTQ